MKTLRELLLGFGLGVIFAVSEYVIANMLLNPRQLGNYTDWLYLAACICVLIWLLRVKRWAFASAFAFWALCFYRPITLLLVGIIGCYIVVSQCPIF